MQYGDLQSVGSAPDGEFWSGVLDGFGIAPDSLPTLSLDPVPALQVNAPTIYLDTNHWISLSKARIGHGDGLKFRDCYEFLCAQTAAGGTRTALSTASYMETGRATIRQRAHLADVMSEITRFVTIQRQSRLLECQLMRALHNRLGRPMFPQEVEPFGAGAGFAFKGNPISHSFPPAEQAAKPMTELIGGTEACDDLLFRFHQLVEYLCLRGPRPEDIALMAGYDLAPVEAVEAEQVQRETDLEAMLANDPTMKLRLDEIVAARELYWELGPDLPRLLSKAGLTSSSLFGRGKEWVTDLIESLPSIAIQKALKVRAFKNASRPWSANDQRDIDHMSVAVPYCDIVVTERHSAAVLRSGGFDVWLGTIILDDLTDLPDAINAKRKSGNEMASLSLTRQRRT